MTKVAPPRQPLQGLPPEVRFWHHVNKTDGCWEWTAFRNEKGYGIFRIYQDAKDKSGKAHYAHRWSWQLHHGPIPDGKIICHRCDNPRCVRGECHVSGCEHLLDSEGCESHLFLGTVQDNSTDQKRKGRAPSGEKNWMHNHPEVHRGERNPVATFTEAQVREIRRLYQQGGMSQKKLAALFGVTAGAVQSVVERKTWDWLDDGYASPSDIKERNIPRGERVSLAKLSERQAKAIKVRYAKGGISHSELAREYGVTKTTIGCLLRGRTWKHIIV